MVPPPIPFPKPRRPRRRKPTHDAAPATAAEEGASIIPPLPPPPQNWQTITLADAQRLPVAVRWSIWMAYGAAMLLPVDALFAAINHQLLVAKRTLGGKRPRWTTAERLLHLTHVRQLPGFLRGIWQWIVSPDALIRWLKRYQQRTANGGNTPPTKPGRPWLRPEKVQAILTIYDAGLTGLSRIVGEMKKCDMTVVEATVRRVLTANGRHPTDSNHRKGSTWAQFWLLHAQHLVGIDFLQIPIGLFGKIVNAFVFLAIEHDTRRVHLLGITINPTDQWIANRLRAATEDGAPLASRKFWILDNDRKYGALTEGVLGKRLKYTSIEVPDMNSRIERFNQSILDECLNHVVLLSEAQLRDTVLAYLQHYHAQRPHQGIGNVPIEPWDVGTGQIVCDESLHGVLKSFRRAA